MSDTFTREQVDAILAPWMKLAKEMEAERDALNTECNNRMTDSLELSEVKEERDALRELVQTALDVGLYNANDEWEDTALALLNSEEG